MAKLSEQLSLPIVLQTESNEAAEGRREGDAAVELGPGATEAFSR
jgi:hypothetical protein